MEPLPGVETWKLSGLRTRFSVLSRSSASFLSQMWLPPVRMFTPASKSSSAVRRMTPSPPAEFSPLAMTTSGRNFSLTSGSTVRTNLRP